MKAVLVFLLALTAIASAKKGDEIEVHATDVGSGSGDPRLDTAGVPGSKAGKNAGTSNGKGKSKGKKVKVSSSTLQSMITANSTWCC